MNKVFATFCTALMAALLLCCFKVARAASTADEQAVELSDSTSTIKGTLMLPTQNADGPAPVALIIAGSGPTDRNGNSVVLPKNDSLQRLALALADQGIASVRYDKRGVGESTKVPESELRFDIYVDDAVRWLAKLSNDRRFDKVIVVGHSEGALIGMLAAQHAKVSAVVSVEGTALRASDLIRLQLKNVLPPDLAEINEAVLTRLESGQEFAAPPASLQALYRPSVQPYMISWFRHRPIEEIRKVGTPVLIVDGRNDKQLEPGAADALKHACPEASLLRVAGMDHLLLISKPDGAADDRMSGPSAIAKAISGVAAAAR